MPIIFLNLQGGPGSVRFGYMFSGSCKEGVFLSFSTISQRGRFQFRFRFLENGSGGSGSAFGSCENGSDGSGFRSRFGSWATLNLGGGILVCFGGVGVNLEVPKLF